jgi:hypothetical protein
MFRILTILIRSITLLFAGSAVLALGVSLFIDPERPGTPVYSQRWETLNRAFRPGHTETDGFYVLDRATGRCELRALPEGEKWGLMAVSPWRDELGDTEILGSCHTLETDRDGKAFWGFARLRLSDGTLIDRIKLDVLPTSRPCWLPDHPGEILFAAGDGALYRISLPPRPDEPSAPDAPAPIIPEGEGPRQVTWACPQPGEGTVFIFDPTWPSHPRLRHLLFATLSYKKRSGDKHFNSPLQPWWLQLSRDGTEIEAAGPLGPAGADRPDRLQSAARFPTVAVDQHGAIRLFYLSRDAGQTASDLISVRLELDPKTCRPRRVEGQEPRRLARNCATIPPIVDADGASVFGISQDSGTIAEFRVIDDAGASRNLAMAARSDAGRQHEHGSFPPVRFRR